MSTPILSDKVPGSSVEPLSAGTSPTVSRIPRVPILIKFDRLLFEALEIERIRAAVGVRADGRPKRPARTDFLRLLVREGIDARRRARGDEVPSLVPTKTEE